MNGQGLVLVAVGLFAALVVTVATVNHRLLDQHPASEARGLLWRVERALSAAEDLELTVSSTDYSSPADAVRMEVRVVVRPTPVVYVRYTEPEALRGQVVTVDNDLLSHYFPSQDTVVIRRWSGLPLAAVGLAALDMTQLRGDLQKGVVTARVLDETTALASIGAAGVILDAWHDETAAQLVPGIDASSTSTFDPALLGFASAEPGFFNPGLGSYVIEVRDATSGELVQAVWVDRATYLIQRIVYFRDEQRARVLEVEDVRINQGLTAEDVLVTPQATYTVRG